MTAVAAGVPLTENKTKRTKTIDPAADNKMVLIDESGAYLLSKEKNGKVKPIGILELEHLSEVFSKKLPSKTGFMPSSCFNLETVFGIKSGKEFYLSCHQFNPCVLELKFQVTASAYKYFTIGLPYVQFFIIVQRYQGKYSRLDNSYVSCTNKPIRSLNDTLYQLPLHNIYRDHLKICFGRQEMPSNHNLSPAVYTEQICQDFLSSTFNSDLTPHAVTGCETYEEWAQNTSKNPNFALQVKYPAITADIYSTPANILTQMYNSLKAMHPDDI